jgi:hypothetical protein
MLDSIHLRCPFCGERFEAVVDPSGGAAEYIEDCPVCCRPITLQLDPDEEGGAHRIEAQRDD